MSNAPALLTKIGESDIFFSVKKKRVFWAAAVFLGLLIGGLRLGGGFRPQDPDKKDTNPQQIQKPNMDYMSTYLSRSTRPLGLIDDPVVKEMLNQSSAKWAIRAGARHVLD